MRAVCFSEAAADEFEESAEYFQNKIDGLGDIFQREIYNLTQAVAQNSDRFSEIDNGTSGAVAK